MQFGATLTFLFTDIQDSTKLWDKHPQSMQSALARHDAILRGAIERHHGKVFKTGGDAFCAVFGDPQKSLLAAINAQQMLHDEPWDANISIKVRMGLHTGPAEERDNDYFGPSLNRVARIMSAGHGGQLLLSATTCELIKNSLPPGFTLRDMGEHNLKGLTHAERIYQLVIPGLPAEFPPLKTEESLRTNNLPTQLTSFIGREQEIATITTLLLPSFVPGGLDQEWETAGDSARLVTLTGSGGTGKTRLSLQVAAGLTGAFPDGIWFVEFAALADPALVFPTVITTLGLREDPVKSSTDLLIQYLRDKKALLILDNCEHLIETIARLAEALLQGTSHLRILASSREALDIPGEHTYYIRSLSIPQVDSPIENLEQYESVRLFIERARAVLPAFALTAANTPAVAKICARLDGIPLAIELAAARVKLLKVEQIAERLDDRFQLLTGGSRTALPRQQTLRAAIDWSYNLLAEPERVLLRRLSVFASGWTLEAAETICQGPGIENYNILDPLSSLVNKSLVMVNAEDESVETRYQLLETIRQYGREKLTESGEGAKIRFAHLQYFLGLAEQAGPEMTGPNMVIWKSRLEKELDNLRLALEWSLKSSPETGLKLVHALIWYWEDSDYASDGFNWLSQFLKTPVALANPALRAQALGIQGRLLIFGNYSNPKAYDLLQESLSLFEKVGDTVGIARGMLYFGLVQFHRQEVAAGKRMALDGLALLREQGDTVHIIKGLLFLGELLDQNDYQRSQQYLQEALALARRFGYLSGAADVLIAIGWKAARYGDYALAQSSLEESLRINRQMNRVVSTVTNISYLGHLSYQMGHYAEARVHYQEFLALSAQTRTYMAIPGFAGWATAKLGYIELKLSDYDSAKKTFARACGHFLSANSKIGVAYTLEGLAALLTRQGNFALAAQLYAWTDVTRVLVDDLRPPVEQVDVDHDLAIIHASLDDAAFAAAQEVGRALPIEEAVRLALEAAGYR